MLEVIQMIEMKNICFPGSDPVVYATLHVTKHFPNIDFDYAQKILISPGNRLFSSVPKFLSASMPNDLRKWIPEANFQKCFLISGSNLDAILFLTKDILHSLIHCFTYIFHNIQI
jgi:hypothetical protein